MEKLNSYQKGNSGSGAKSTVGHTHIKSRRANSAKCLDDVMRTTLVIHSILSIEIGKHFSNTEQTTQYKKLLKKALIFVDKLDTIVEPLNSIAGGYQKAYQELFQFLEQLGLSKNIARIIKKEFTQLSFIRISTD